MRATKKQINNSLLILIIFLIGYFSSYLIHSNYKRTSSVVVKNKVETQLTKKIPTKTTKHIKAITLTPILKNNRSNKQLSNNIYEVNNSLNYSLKEIGVKQSTIDNIINSAKTKHNLNTIPKDVKFWVNWDEVTGEIAKIEIQLNFNSSRVLIIEKIQNNWQARIFEYETKTKHRRFSNTIYSSFWDSARNVSMPISVIVKLSEIFSWQFDFNHEVRIGDTWRLVVEEFVWKGGVKGYGNVLVAEYVRGKRVLKAVLSNSTNGQLKYYKPDGESLKGLFLKSPIKYARITSKFSMRRFHPILKVYRPHLGIDYGAKRGTEIMSIGDGIVTYVGYNKYAGKMIKIKHTNKYSTTYKHLNKYADNIKVGSIVNMSQLIGYVGSSGRATGAHLHFEFLINNKFTNPEGLKFPSSDPIPKSLKEDFLKKAKTMWSLLPPRDREFRVPLKLAQRYIEEDNVIKKN